MPNKMFENFDNTPSDYIPNNTITPTASPLTHRLPMTIYDIKGRAKGYTWNQGDTVYLEFETTGNVVWDESDGPQGVWEDAETYLKGKMFKLLILNFRYEVVAYCTTKADTRVRILSDTFEPHTLDKGTYKLKLDLVDKNDRTLCTLIKPEECELYIS